MNNKQFIKNNNNNNKIIENNIKLYKLYKLKLINEIKDLFYYNHFITEYDYIIHNLNKSELDYNIKILYNINLL